MSFNFTLLLYGKPGVGKSYFAFHLPKPHFITTDNNYGYLIRYGADPKACTRISNWDEYNAAVEKVSKLPNSVCETVVLDLLEDAYRMCIEDFQSINKIQYVGDMDHGKGWKMSEVAAVGGICRLINCGKNVVLISHETSYDVKNRYGITNTYYQPSDRTRDIVLEQIMGNCTFVLRCYTEDTQVENSDKLVKKRFLSLVPTPYERGVTRCIDEDTAPQIIPLDANEFLKAIGYYEADTNYDVVHENKNEDVKEIKTLKQLQDDIAKAEDDTKDKSNFVAREEDVQVEVKEVKEEVKQPEQKVEEPKEEKKEESKPMTPQERLAAIKAKIAAKKAAEGK